MANKSPKGSYSLIHNPGYDFLVLLRSMVDAKPDDTSLPFAPYLIPTIAILGACCAIEGFINMVGQKIDIKWSEFDKGPIAIRKRIERIYNVIGKNVDFSQGIWQQVINLFDVRVKLVHPRFVEKTEKRANDIPDLFDVVNSTYPPSKSQEIAENAIDSLLRDTGLIELRHKHIFRMYSGPVREPL